jgi:hypothetical protein
LPRLFPENVIRTVDAASALVNISAMSKTATKNEAADLGRAAHAAGRIRFPGADAALMALVNGCPSFSDERSALMAAWLRAYDACVCAALMSFDPNA